jgi:hypothetical protein
MKNTEQYALFPTLLLVKKKVLKEEQCKDIFEYAKTLDLEPHGVLVGDAKSSFEMYNKKILEQITLHVPSCVNIMSVVKEVVNEYSITTGIEYKNIDNSWINIQNDDSEILTHIHAMSIMSGAIYINVDVNSSPITFFNPNPLIKFSPPHAYSNYNCEWCSFQPEVGDLFVFPSWLSHGSGGVKNNTPNRTVISFNTF